MFNGSMKNDEGTSTILSWADAQEQFSAGAGPMSQGLGGSPFNFLDLNTCDTILQDLRRADGTLPSFDSVSDTPPPVLEAAVACDRQDLDRRPRSLSRCFRIRALRPFLLHLGLCGLHRYCLYPLYVIMQQKCHR